MPSARVHMAQVSLDEFIKIFDLGPRVEFSRSDNTSAVLSPVLDGHEAKRERLAKLKTSLEEAVPEEASPNLLSLPPAFSES